MKCRRCSGVKGRGGAVDPSGTVWLDALMLVLLLALTLLGARRGALESSLRLAGWIGGYAAALFVAPRAGGVAAAFGAPEGLQLPLAWVFSVLAFVAVQIAVAIAVVFVRRRRAESEPGSGDRLLGGLFGAARGAILVVMVGWLALFADAFSSRMAAQQQEDSALGRSHAARWSGTLIERGAGAVLGDEDPTARAAVALVAHPRESFDALQGVLGDPHIAALQADAGFWSRLDAGEIDAALSRPSARALVGDAALRERIAALRLVDARTAADPLAFEAAVRDALVAVAPRLRALRSDPALAELLEDPQVQALVERGDVLLLLADPRFRGVVQRAAGS